MIAQVCWSVGSSSRSLRSLWLPVLEKNKSDEIIKFAQTFSIDFSSISPLTAQPLTAVLKIFHF